jgi:hypothetical protein
MVSANKGIEYITSKKIVMKRMIPNLNVMKRIIPILAFITVMASCNSKPEATVNGAAVQAPQQPASTLTPEDSLVLTQFRAWKAQNELSDAQAFLNGDQNNANANNQSNTATRSSSGTAARRSTASRSTGSRTASSSGTGTTARKKGWSSAAKGAVIGGVAGAAGGAVINKRNRAAGAVIAVSLEPV